MNEFETQDVWIPANSSNIAAFAYVAGDPLGDTGTLAIRFKSGQEYRYEKFPAQLAEDFFGAESVGKFFHANIRGQFKGVKVEEVPEEPTEEGGERDTTEKMESEFEAGDAKIQEQQKVIETPIEVDDAGEQF